MTSHDPPAADRPGADATGLTPGDADWVDWCWQDMETRAARGDHTIRAEDYLAGVADASDALRLDLIYGEYVVRTAYADGVSGEELAARFPDLAAAIARQLELDGVLDELDATEDALCTTVVMDVNAGEQHPAAADEPAFHRTATPAAKGALDPHPLPEQIGRYRIIEALSPGGQADIFRAFDSSLGRDVIVKLQRQAAAEAPTPNEVVVAGHLQHPHLALTLDCGVFAGRPYSVSRFVSGQTFDRWVKRHRPRPEVVAQKIAQIGEALEVVHHAGVLHRDIKPQNILIDAQGTPVLIDFGLSLGGDSLRTPIDALEAAPGLLCGTPCYMSPEQAGGHVDKLGCWTDIFGLGATLYAGLTGQPPYAPPRTLQDLNVLQRGDWRRDALENADASPRLKAVVAAAMAADPQARYASASEFVRAIRAAIEPEEAPPATKRTIFIVLGLLAFVLVGVALVAIGRQMMRRDDTLTAGAPGESDPLTVLVLDERGQETPISDKTPLQTGALIRCQAQVPASRAAVLFSVDPSGISTVLASCEASQASQTLYFPVNRADASPLVGGAGTEVIGLCFGEDVAAIAAGISSLPAQPFEPLAELSVIRIHMDQLVSSDQQDKGTDAAMIALLSGDSRSLGKPTTVHTGNELLQSQIRARLAPLRERGLELHVVAFSHQDADETP